VISQGSSGPTLAVSHETEGRLRVRLSGCWSLAGGVPALAAVESALASGQPVSAIAFEASLVEAWDSALVTFVYAVALLASRRGLALDPSGLPEGVRRLLALAQSVPPRDVTQPPEDDALTARVGRVTLHAWGTAGDAITFLGETVLALGRLLQGRARLRRVDLLHALEVTGVGALAIVALINFLVGAVLAFVGSLQLQPFGAAIYVANLVAIAVTRELAALMTGIVMAGRTGAAFAAVLGTMSANEEVDALRTMGLPPLEFLVLPRVLATALMMPALVAYADLLGLLGGLFVGVTTLGLGPDEYLRQTRGALTLSHLLIGLGKSVVFGIVVALTGCYYGMRCGRDAAAVGVAATKAVVMGIVLVVVADAAFTVLFHLLRV
jgi:phospholipid/cholesterol/gamma-HCH transport system permease protein